MPVYRENWYEDKVPYESLQILPPEIDFSLEDLPYGVKILPSPRLSSEKNSNTVYLDRRELHESLKRSRAGWEEFHREQARIRQEFEEKILDALSPPEPDTEELEALRQWNKVGVVKYGYVDDGELSDEQIEKMMKAYYKIRGSN